MKSQFARIKNRASSVSTRALAVMLCFVMLLTAVGAGTMMTAIAAGGAATPVADAAQKVIDIADSVDVPAAEVAEDEAPTETVFDKLKKQLSELSSADADDEAPAPKRNSAELAVTGDDTYYAFYVTDNSKNASSATSVQMTATSDGGYYFSFTSANANFDVLVNNSSTTGSILNTSTTTEATGVTIHHIEEGGGYHWLVGYATSGTTVYITYYPSSNKIKASNTAPSGGSGSGSGESGSGDSGSSTVGGKGTKVTDSSLIAVLKEESVRFYAKTFNGNNTGVRKAGYEESGFKDCFSYLGYQSGNTNNKNFIVQLTNTERSTYKYITDNKTWQGNQNQSITASVGGEYYNGTSAYTTAGASGSTIGNVADADTTIEASYKFYEVMNIATIPNATTTSYGSPLLIRYYIKSGSDFYELDGFGDLAANASGLSSNFDLTDLGVGSYTLLTVGISNVDENDRNKCMAYVLDKDNFTVTDDVANAPTISKASDSIVFNLKAETKKVHIWNHTTPSGADHNVTGFKSYTDGSSVKRYLAYLENVTASGSPGAIAYHDALNDNNKYTGDITGGSGSSDGVYYFHSDDTPSKSVTGNWQAFSHISTELTINSSSDAYSMGTGDTVTITNTPGGTLATPGTAANQSGLSTAQAKYIYYVVAPDGTPTKINNAFSATNTYDFTPTTTGTYKVFSYVQDMWGYETAISDNVLTINVLPAYKVTVKSNNARLGTGTASPANAFAGQTVTINISENMGTFSSIAVKGASGNTITPTAVTEGSVYTFTMPSSAVTVNLVFEEINEDSTFYYNGYDTSGNPLEGYYGEQMSVGMVGGQKYSYYHVLDRSGTDQLFTVSYGSPKYNSYNAYFEIWSGWESGGVKAQFYATDGNNLGDYANMTYDGKTDSDQKKKFKIAIPDGARKVQFKHGGNTTGILNLYQGNNAWFTKTSFTDLGAYNSGNPVPVDFYENFNGESKYTANFDTKGFYKHSASRGASHDYTKPKDLGTSSNDYYIVVLYNTKEYTINGVKRTVDKDPEIIWMKELPGAEDIDSSEVTVYGKDGSVVIDWNNKPTSGASDTSGTAYGYGVIADTHLFDEEGNSIGTSHVDDGNDFESATVGVTSDYGTDIIIKTTISSSYTSKYYLKGWCIDGVTYACGNNVKGVNASDAGTASGSDRLYEMTYTVPAGSVDGSKIEITPIYYLKNNSNCITFYLEGYNTVVSKWGNTPYIYPFYGDLNNVDNSFGVYPGQPMVFANGQYSVEVPIVNNPIYKATSNVKVKGITISNGYADHVHRNLVYKWTDHDNDADHKQTYDYDDFYKIYEECLKNGNEHPNAIFFRIQDEDTVYNRSEYGGGKSGQFASGTSNIDINTIATSGNGWELLVNRYDNAVNIFGDHTGITNPGSGVTATNDTANALYVVSTGYNANIAGDYGTMWKVYNGSGQLISNGGGRVGIPPSVLLLRGNASGYTTTVTYPSADRSVEGVGSYKDSINDYLTIYKALHNSNYTNKRVYITYEKDAQDTRKVTSGTGAYRLDGRWYYTHKSDQVQSKIGIEYWNENNASWVTDTMSGTTGEYTDCTAKFSNNSTTSPSYIIENNGTYSFSATTAAGWKFDSWQIKYSETSYDPISTGISATLPATASYQIVARFVPIDAGSLTINHTLNAASSGEGTTTMEVKVYTDSSKTTLVTGGEKSGSRVYLDGTFINNDTAANYVVNVTLKTTPKYDGKVSAFTYDEFNTDNGIAATTVPAELPGGENTLTTSTFDIPVISLYNLSTQKTKTLNYTSMIDETLHYYNFVYEFTDRAGVSKSYTSKGVLNMTEYKKVVSDEATHTLDNSILVAKAPFESNFLKSNTLTKGTITWTAGTHTYSATSTYSQAPAVPTYHVVFKLPYDYLTTGNLSATPPTKKYTVTDAKTYNADKATFDLLAEYNTFVTVNATSSTVGPQENVNKVTDGSDINHANNNFITAPEELNDGGKTMYFQYWDVKKLKSDGTAGDQVTKIYYPDFHYRVYSGYYVEAKYSDQAANSWKHHYSEDDNTDVDCSILYLGDSRNQWNNGSGASSTSADVAADKIYSDFIFHYTHKGQELKNVNDVEVGMILERATYIDTKDNNTQKWLTGSTSVNDMSYYRATYGGNNANSTESTRKTAILAALNNDTALPSGTIKQQWANSVLNNKNFTEQSYSAYSQYGQTVANDTITFAKDSVVDDYVYRAYAYIKDEDGGYTLSDPVYFSMRYTSNLKYTE